MGRLTRLTALARTALKGFLVACGARKSATIIAWPASLARVMRPKLDGATTIAASATVIRFNPSFRSARKTSRAAMFAAVGSMRKGGQTQEPKDSGSRFR